MGDGLPVRQALLVAGFIALLLTFCTCVSADTSPDFPIGLFPDSVGRYEKLEIISFAIDSTGYNPFDENEISVKGHFFRDENGDGEYHESEKVAEVYGFWYQEYERSQSGKYEVLEPEGPAHWLVRYAPKEEGQYDCYVTVGPDLSNPDVVESMHRQFTVTASDNPGFLRVPAGGSRYFQFDNGESFFGLGMSPAHWGGPKMKEKTYWYDEFFTSMSNYKGNFARVWVINSISVFTDWVVTIQDSQLGANYDLADAWRLDHILNSAKDNGIYIQLNLEDVNSFAYNWYNAGEYGEKNLYAYEAGGPCQDRWDYFTRQDARDYAKRVYRYMVARYGYSTNLASWELWNEIDCIQYWTDLANAAELLAWHQEFGQWFKDNDPNDHIVTTSYGSFTPGASMWRLDEIEYGQMHGYYVPGWTAHPSDPLARNMADFINYYTKMALSRMADDSINKPVVFGEFGLVNENWIISEWQDGVAPDDFEGIHLHNGFWSGLMSGLASTPLEFWSHYCLEEGYPAYFEHCRAIANFVADENLSSAGYVPVSEESISVSNAGLGALGLKNDTGGLFWIQNKEHTWYRVVAEGLDPPVITGATLTIPQLTIGSYAVEWWDTYSGTVVDEEHVLVDESGIMTVAVPPLQKDIAFKVVRDPDADLDGLPDAWELAHGLDPLDPTGDNGGDGDPDGDGLTNLEEYSNGTHPRVGDTDGDGLTDGAEVHTYGTDPTDADTDNDRLDDGAELNTHGTDPRDPDTDGDDLRDGDEVRDLDPYTPGLQNPFDPLNPDSTGDNFSNVPDGVPDGQNDYDGDGQTNEYELRWGPYVGNPLDPTVTVPALAMAALCMLVTVILVAGSRRVRHEHV